MSNKKEKNSFKEQIKMDTQKSCEQAIKTGWIAALISLGMTLILSSIGFVTQSENEKLNYILNPWSIIDAILMGILAFYIYKKSRVAATLMFIYFIISKFSQWFDLGNVQGFPLALVFMVFYFNAMRGTFMWHSMYKNIDK